MVTNHLQALNGIYFTKNHHMIFSHFLDMVRCSVKSRYYLKFHGRHFHTSDGLQTIFVQNLNHMISTATVSALARHCTVSKKVSGTFENLSTNGPMTVWSPDNARLGTGRCFISQILLEQQRMNNIQRTRAIDFLVLCKCGFHFHYRQSQLQSVLF